jgi:cytochrome b561
MPITGYLGTGADTDFFFLFEIPKFADTAMYTMIVETSMGLSAEEFAKPLDFIHKELLGEWFVWMLVLGHIGAAIYHHRVKKDRTLRKMTTG